MNIINYIKKIPVRSVLIIFLLLAGFLIFAGIVVEVLLEKEGNIDAAAFSLFTGLNNSVFTKLMIFVSLLGSSYFLLPAYILLVIYFLKNKQKQTAIAVSTIAIASTLMVYLLKLFFHRARPENPLDALSTTYSFPSGHTASSFIFYGLLIYLIWNRNLITNYKYFFSLLLFLLALLIAFSRVYLHKHFASDVVAGLCVAVIWLCVAAIAMKHIKSTSPIKSS